MTGADTVIDPSRLTQRECSEIVELSQSMRSLRRLGKLLGVAPLTLDKIVCGRRRARPETIAKVRGVLAARRVIVVAHEGVH